MATTSESEIEIFGELLAADASGRSGASETGSDCVVEGALAI